MRTEFRLGCGVTYYQHTTVAFERLTGNEASVSIETCSHVRSGSETEKES